MSTYLVQRNTSKKISIGSYVSKLAGALLEKTPAGGARATELSPKSPRSRQKPDGTEKTSGRRGRARGGC